MPKREPKTTATASATGVAAVAVGVPAEAFTPVELIAIAGVVKDKELAGAKAALTDGFSGNVDLTVRISGGIQKGQGTPASSVVVQRVPSVSLRDFDTLLVAIKKLGIGPARLSHALTQIGPDDHAAPELVKCFETEEYKRTSALPVISEQVNSPGRAGAVQSQVSATRVAVG